MWHWSTFLLIGLIVVIVTLWIALTIINNKNANYSYTQVLYPFSAILDQTNPNGQVNLEKQIKCPDGYECNIVAAFSQVYDPYSTCSNPSTLILNTCGTQGGTNPISGSDPTACECRPSSNVTTRTNNMCYPGTSQSPNPNYKNCKIRDVTAYLSDMVRNKQPLNYPLGPYPCNIDPTSPDYKNLPYASVGQDTACDQGRQGYYIHGLFTCVPNNES
jgi:hypothetical protein